jgi:putative acetyltransferase
MSASLSIRLERPGDQESIRRLTLESFENSELGYGGEAELIDRVRDAHGSECLSLVAEEEGEVLGHILFSPATIESEEGELSGMGLAPMAVATSKQKRGIGSALVREGLRRLREAGTSFVIVLGHPNYYPRFGFLPASQLGVRCEFEGIPDEAFMLLRLAAAPLSSGLARYLPEFSEL